MTVPAASAAGDERDRSEQREAGAEPHAPIVAHVKPRVGRVHHRHIGSALPPTSPQHPIRDACRLLAETRQRPV
jgi:hypothetical protein